MPAQGRGANGRTGIFAVDTSPAEVDVQWCECTPLTTKLERDVRWRLVDIIGVRRRDNASQKPTLSHEWHVSTNVISL
jgi:hypothetical protein